MPIGDGAEKVPDGLFTCTVLISDLNHLVLCEKNYVKIKCDLFICIEFSNERRRIWFTGSITEKSNLRYEFYNFILVLQVFTGK
jgi:hypothetical protein